MEALRPCFARGEPYAQAGKYVNALMSDLKERNGWSIAQFSGDRTPDKTQRLLSRAVWDAGAAMSAVRKVRGGRAGGGGPQARAAERQAGGPGAG
jgi:hypothetical protein